MFIGQSPANCLIFLGQILHFASTPRFVGWSPMFAGSNLLVSNFSIVKPPFFIVKSQFFHGEISAASKSIDFSRLRTASRHSKRLPANNVCLGAAINACADADLWRHGMLESEPEKCHWNQEFYWIDPPTIWPHIFWSTSTNWHSDGIRKKEQFWVWWLFPDPKRTKALWVVLAIEISAETLDLLSRWLWIREMVEICWDYEFATHNLPKVFA